jgi:hypothetical protein
VVWGKRMAARCGEASDGWAEWGDIFLREMMRHRADMSIGPVVVVLIVSWVVGKTLAELIS